MKHRLADSLRFLMREEEKVGSFIGCPSDGDREREKKKEKKGKGKREKKKKGNRKPKIKEGRKAF